VVSTLASINTVNRHRARLVLGWVTIGQSAFRLCGVGNLFFYIFFKFSSLALGQFSGQLKTGSVSMQPS